MSNVNKYIMRFWLIFGPSTSIQMKTLKSFIDAKSRCILYLLLSMVIGLQRIQFIYSYTDELHQAEININQDVQFIHPWA